MRRLARSIGLALALLLPPASADASDPPRAVDPVHAKAVAVEKAVRWLGEHVFALPDASGSPRKPFTLAITGIDLLLTSGTTNDRAAADRIRRCKEGLSEFIAVAQKRTHDARELPTGHGVADSSKICQYTWVLGAASLFFAEARARGLYRSEADRAFTAIATLLVEAQDENGGFGHGRIASPGTERAPDASEPPLRLARLAPLGTGYPSTLVSTTNVVASGLGLARPWFPAGPASQADALLARLRSHYPRAQVAAGNFPYDLSQRSAGEEPTSVGRTAGAIAAMRAIGIAATTDAIRRAEAFYDRRMDELAEGHGSPALNVFLGALAAKMRGEAAQKEFERRFVPRILEHARDDGSLDCICRGTAFGVTCDSPDHGMLAGAGAVLAEGQKAYVTALLLFPLLLDASGRMRCLEPSGGAAAPRTPPPTTPSDPATGAK